MITASLIFSIIAAGSAICSILAFCIARQKDNSTKIISETTLRDDLRYLRENVDNVRVDFKEFRREQQSLSEKLSRDDIRLQQLERRLDSIEKTLQIKN